MQNTRVLVSFLIRAAVVGLAAAFLVVWWKPALLGKTAAVPRRRSRPTVYSRPPVVMQSFADAVARAAPAVVNIYTARVVTERTQPPRSINCSAIFGRATGSASSAAWVRASSSMTRAPS